MPEPIAPLPVGKLPPDLLARLLARYGSTDPRLLMGPGTGRDCAVIDLGDRLLVAKSDPITFAADEIGWYAVHVNANDIATTGAEPRWFLATALLPEAAATPESTESIFAQIHAACGEVGASLVGGHTEITAGLHRPIVCGTMLGEVSRADLITPAGARPGDLLVLAGGIAIEATALIAREFAADLRRRAFDESFIARCRDLLRDPGISVVPAARLLRRHARVHAMHDPTEGGIATALHEISAAAGVGLAVDLSAIPVLPECASLCRTFGLDPLGVIASGALLAAVDPASPAGWREAVQAGGVACVVIGRASDAGEGVRFEDGQPVPRFERDEIAKLYEPA